MQPTRTFIEKRSSISTRTTRCANFRLASVGSLFVVLLLSVNISHAATLLPAPPNIAAASYVLMESSTGEVLLEFNSGEKAAPASLTKIMTSYVVAAELEAGRLEWLDEVPVSIKAWKAVGSRMFIREGTNVPVIDLLRGVIVVSGNDSSVALAEHISGTERDFADFMNQYGQAMGLENSNFTNSTGLDEEGHYTSAYDTAVLTRHLIEDHPEVYALYAELDYTYNDIKQPNRNELLVRDSSVDGVKTGYTSDAGYNLVASAKRDGFRLISVVLGTESPKSRTIESAKLLNYGFRNYKRHLAVMKDQEMEPVRVYFGVKQSLKVAPSKSFHMLLTRGKEDDVQVVPELTERIEAPVKEGMEVGVVNVIYNDEVKGSVPLVALEGIEEVGFFARIWESMKLAFE